MRSCFRRSSPLSALSLAALASLLCAAACGNEIVRGGPRGAGGDVAAPSSSTGEGASGGAPVTSTSGGWQTTGSGSGALCAGPSSTLPPSACNPTAAQGCGVPPSVCLATVDAHAAPSFGLRIAQLTLSAPTALATGVAGSVLQHAVEQRLLACNLAGQGGLDWLLAFDTANATLTTGAAAPLPDGDPSPGPYSFLGGTAQIGGVDFYVGPATLSAPVDAACGFASGAGDVNLPIYQGGPDPLTLLPLHALRFHSASLTADHNCIGALDPSVLDPENGCAPFPGRHTFTDGGSLDAFILLAEADTVMIPPLDQSLCVLLSGDAQQYGDGLSPERCARGPGHTIVFQGNWCAATDQPATPDCADAVRFAGTFAASGTTIQ